MPRFDHDLYAAVFAVDELATLEAVTAFGPIIVDQSCVAKTIHNAFQRGGESVLVVQVPDIRGQDDDLAIRWVPWRRILPS